MSAASPVENVVSMKFSELDPALSEQSLQAVAEFGFTHMTPVQASAIPQFLRNKDVCVEATTGSGKTLAFGIPVFEIIRRCLGDKQPGKHDTYALIMAPTRELASQIYEVLSKIAKHHNGYTVVLMVGGTHVNECCTTYQNDGGHVIIGTPGRILDVKNRIPTVMTFKKLEILVLDEADTLLDMGFKDTINQLLSVLPKQRRTGLFSATQTKEVRELARAGLRNPVSISVRVQAKAGPSGDHSTGTGHSGSAAGVQQATPSTLDNSYMVCPHDQRPDELVNFLNTHQHHKIIVFCATCACVDYYSNVFEQIAKRGVLLPKTLEIIGFHGKMIPKKRTLLYKKFVGLPAGAGGVMFSTDVAARGVDIPDVDWIVQLAAPKDPAFFVHRVGRTARAGKVGGALLFVTAEEQSYVDLLRGRGVPLRERAPTFSADLHSAEATTIETASGTATCRSPLMKEMKLLAMTDRTVLESGSTAFMAFLRAYKEHMCSYIFRFDQLDIGAVARAYALLRLPKIPETRGVKGRPIDFEITNIDTSTIPYPHKEQEEARQRRLREAYAAAEEQDRVGREATATNSGSDISDAEGRRDEPGTTKFTPHEIFLPKTKAQKKAEQAERKRKQKGGVQKKIMEEWEDLAAEEMAYKKFKKGQISKAEYDACLFSDKKLALDPITKQPILRKSGAGNGGGESDSDDVESDDSGAGARGGQAGKAGSGSDDSSDDDSDASSDESDRGNARAKKVAGGAGKKPTKPQMRFQYQDESDGSDDDSDAGGSAKRHKASGKHGGGGAKGKGKGKGGGFATKGGGKAVKSARPGQKGDYRSSKNRSRHS